MNRQGMLKRLERLEQQNQPEKRFHIVLGACNEEVDAKLVDLMASDAWSPDDDMLVVRFVQPGEVQAQGAAA